MVMINKILLLVKEKLENVLQSSYPRSDQWVVLGNPPRPDDPDLSGRSNGLTMSLVSLQSDVSTSSFVPPSFGRDDRYYTTTAPLYIDAHVMFAGTFDNQHYESGLAQLSRTISFFQETPTLTRENSPNLPPEMDKLHIEMVSLDLAQASHLLTMTGARYCPFVLYRMRRLPFAAQAITSVAPAIRSADRPDALPAGAASATRAAAA